jgi:ankyrin repeat protein
MTLGRPHSAADLNLCQVIQPAGPGRLKLVKHLLFLGAPVNATSLDEYRYYPLHIAMMLNAVDIVELLETLLEYGADVKCQGPYGRTPLHVAAKGGRWWATETLLMHDPTAASIQDEEGRTALDIARKEDWKRVVQVLEAAMGGIKHYS